MRKPDTIERMYLDFDGFFASVEQQLNPRLRGRPVGVVPYLNARTCVIAVSREAKAFGVKNVMRLDDAKALCPDIVLVPQQPDMYRRAHNALLSEIETVLPLDAIKSIDELSCKLDPTQRHHPEDISHRIKSAISKEIGEVITCSIGFAANRHLAKIAGGTQKPNGTTIWQPRDMPEPLLSLPLNDIPGIGSRMAARLQRANINTTEELLATQPKQMRALWRSVTGERLWYALHGYDIQAENSKRGMFGHARVLPPNERSLGSARTIARLLLIKAARRLRRENYYASLMWLHFDIRGGGWFDERKMSSCHDDQALLKCFGEMWSRAISILPNRTTIFRIGVTLGGLTRADSRQLDLFIDDDRDRQKWERINQAMDSLNMKYAKTVASLGPYTPPAGGNIGGKISYTRIPSAMDFW